MWSGGGGGDTHWYHQLLFSPHKPITHWLNIEVMDIMTKTCNIGAVTIYNSLAYDVTYKTLGHLHPIFFQHHIRVDTVQPIKM